MNLDEQIEYVKTEYVEWEKKCLPDDHPDLVYWEAILSSLKQLEELKSNNKTLMDVIKSALSQQPYMATRVIKICDELRSAIESIGE